MNDGELLFNCGTWHLSQKPLLADVGGISSLLPLMDHMKTLISLQSARMSALSTKTSSSGRSSERSAGLINQFLELAIVAISNQ